MRKVNFTCSNCGKSDGIEEVCECDGVTSEIVAMDNAGNTEYGHCQGHGDTVNVRYQCCNCGAVIDDVDDPVHLLTEGVITLGEEQADEPTIRQALRNLTTASRTLVARLNQQPTNRGLVNDDFYRHLTAAERVVQNL